MLNRNYYGKRNKVLELFDKVLLKPNDFNVRVTVVDKESNSSEGCWKETFRDSIGGGIINDSTNQYYIDIITGSGATIQVTDVGTNIIKDNFDCLKNEDLVRINLIKLPKENNNPKSWIFIRV